MPAVTGWRIDRLDWLCAPRGAVRPGPVPPGALPVWRKVLVLRASTAPTPEAAVAVYRQLIHSHPAAEYRAVPTTLSAREQSLAGAA